MSQVSKSVDTQSLNSSPRDAVGAAGRLPVVATASTGTEELVIDAVEDFAVPIRSPEAIRGKVLYFYEKSEMRDDMSRLAFRRVQAIWGWDVNSVSEASVCANSLGQRQGVVRKSPSKIVVDRSG